VRLLDKKHGSFFISRLILITGINVRTFDQTSYDDPVAVGKIIKALQSSLPQAEYEALLPLLVTQR